MIGCSLVPLSSVLKTRVLSKKYFPPRTMTVRAPGSFSLTARTASRAFTRVAKGPSVFAAFGAASFPDHPSLPSVATKNVASDGRGGDVPLLTARVRRASITPATTTDSKISVLPDNFMP